jgi:hypothetical protein
MKEISPFYYLEGVCVFNNDEWKQRTQWIVQLLLPTFQESRHAGGYWIAGASNIVTADLFKGTSGILNFLFRYHSSK